MARRASNRDRIARMRDEAEARRREQEQVQAAAGRAAQLRAVWAVRDGAGNVVAVFPFDRKEAAEAEAQRRKAAERRDFIVCRHKVPLDA